MIPKRLLSEFFKIYKQTYGEELTEAELVKKTEYLLNLYREIYGNSKSEPRREINDNE